MNAGTMTLAVVVGALIVVVAAVILGFGPILARVIDGLPMR